MHLWRAPWEARELKYLLKKVLSELALGLRPLGTKVPPPLEDSQDDRAFSTRARLIRKMEIAF